MKDLQKIYTDKVNEALFRLQKCESLIESYFEIKDLLDKSIIQVQMESPKIYRKELVELLFEQTYSKIEYVVDKLNVERKAASRYLKELENIGLLESQKIGRETIYLNKKLIEILKK